MDATAATLTVLFEEPFWIGLYERTVGNRYEVCKITFGSEPKDYEVYAFLLENWHRLTFSPPVRMGETEPRTRAVNPKRVQREVNRQLQDAGVGTKAQQALKLQQEQNKLVRKERSKAQREAEEARQFALRQEKRKEKHRGH